MTETAWWQVPLLTGAFALIGVLIAQSIVLYLWRRNDKRRSDSELLKHCALFSASCGRLKRELTYSEPSERDYGCLDDLEAAYEALNVLAPKEIDKAAERVISYVPLAIGVATTSDGKYITDEARREIFNSHRLFKDAVREYFGRPPREYVAVPMIRRPTSTPPVEPTGA